MSFSSVVNSTIRSQLIFFSQPVICYHFYHFFFCEGFQTICLRTFGPLFFVCTETADRFSSQLQVYILFQILQVAPCQRKHTEVLLDIISGSTEQRKFIFILPISTTIDLNATQITVDKICATVFIFNSPIVCNPLHTRLNSALHIMNLYRKSRKLINIYSETLTFGDTFHRQMGQYTSVTYHDDTQRIVF